MASIISVITCILALTRFHRSREILWNYKTIDYLFQKIKITHEGDKKEQSYLYSSLLKSIFLYLYLQSLHRHWFETMFTWRCEFYTFFSDDVHYFNDVTIRNHKYGGHIGSITFLLFSLSKQLIFPTFPHTDFSRL